MDEKKEITQKLAVFKEGCLQLGMDDTANVAEIIIKRLKENSLDESFLTDFGNHFQYEFSQQNRAFRNSYDILWEIFLPVLENSKEKRKQIDIFPDELGRIDALEKNLGTLFDEIDIEMIKESKELTKKDVAILLLMHIIRKDVWYGHFRLWFIKMGNLGGIKKEERKQLLDDYFTLIIKNDVTHIRNAIAHANFIFHEDNKIEFWDFDKETNEENFRVTVNYSDILGLNNLFEKKVRFLHLFIKFQILIQRLYLFVKINQ